MRWLALLVLALACRSEAPPVRIQVAATILALDERTVEVRFTQPLEDDLDWSTLRAFAPFSEAELPILNASASESVLTLETAPQTGGALYALVLGELRFVGAELVDAPTQLNFVGYGKTSVIVRLDARGFVPPAAVNLAITADPASGEYRDQVTRVPMTQSLPQVYTATISVRILPERLFAVRAETADGQPAGQLSTFRAASDEPVHVGLTPVLPRVPEFAAPLDPQAGDGFAPVRLILDDRYARELRSPQLRLSLDQNGRFDGSASRLVRATPVPGKPRVYEVLVPVAVDPNRVLDGTDSVTFPYVTFLVEGGEDIAQRGTTFIMPEERPQVIVIPMGNPALVPVTFRIEAGSSFLEPSGPKGKYPGEGIFLTGEFPSSEDALGRLAADAFTGGERATLEMRERPDAPGIYEKTVFMPPNRPYGWKVVRCPTGLGCAELNRRVISSGRAFPTVMKNLATENVDAAGNPSVKIVDPQNLGEYANARVSADGTEAPSPSVLFKQETPDLVVTVGTEPIITPIYVVGTWRDVNIPETPAEIIENNSTLELSAFDYDDGLEGGPAIERDRQLPVDPGQNQPNPVPGVPAFNATDGQLDATAFELFPNLHVAWNQTALYVATEIAAPGRDVFVMVSLDPPMGLREANWAKGGQTAQSARQVFLAQEGDGDFHSWFRWGASSMADAAFTGPAGRATVLEGALDPVAAGLGPFGERIWIAVLRYGTNDGDPLSSQIPNGNANLDVEAAEFHEVVLSTVRAQ